MPLFTLSPSPVTPGCLSIAQWIDPSTSSAPSRLNGNPLYPAKYRRVQAPSVGGSATIQIAAVVDGVTAPSDASLGGGQHFWFSWLEFSGQAPAMIISPLPGFSSVIQATFVNQFGILSHAGHHLLSCRMLNGGASLLPLDVEA